MNNFTGKIYQTYLSRYKKQLESFEKNYLTTLIQNEKKKAKLAYQKLPSPKIYSQKTYISGWLNEVLHTDLNTKIIQQRGRNPDKYPKYFSVLKSITKYFELIPIEILENPSPEQQVYGGDPIKRIKKWKKLKLPLKKIEKRFKNLIISRNNLAQENGFSSFIEMRLNNAKISKFSYNYFLTNMDRVIEYCNQNLPKDKTLPSWFYQEFNTPCFLCRIPKYPFASQKQVTNFMFKQFPILHKHKTKIKINYKNEGPSKIKYIKETDNFHIFIDKRANSRHQSVSLLHELSHAVIFIKNAKKDIDWIKKGKYLNEKEAIQMESRLLKKYFPEIFKANLADILLNLRRTSFEIELYKQPRQNIGKLYAQTFNRCFKKAIQKNNPLFIIDDGVIMHPLSNLPHAIASVNILSKYL